MNIFRSTEYQMIAAAYGSNRTERSNILLINHIDEGLSILDKLGAYDTAKRAYCLHPLVQGDEALVRFLTESPEWERKFGTINANALVLAMEYRAVANVALSTRLEILDCPDLINLGPLPEVAQMLVADKVQNRKDFETYHKGTHARSAELDRYFRSWLTRLGVDEGLYQTLIKEVSPP